MKPAFPKHNSEKSFKASLAGSLKKAVWGIATDPEALKAQKIFFKDRMYDIVNNIFNQGKNEVCVAIQLLILFTHKDEKCLYHGNAKRILTTNPTIIPEALEEIYWQLTSLEDKLRFISHLNIVAKTFREHMQVFIPLNHFSRKKENFEYFLDVIAEKLKNELSFAYTFSDNRLHVNAFDKNYSFQLLQGTVTPETRNPHVIFIDLSAISLVSRYIGLRVLALVIADSYKKNTRALGDVSFESFCETRPSAKGKNHQATYDEMKNFINQQLSSPKTEVTESLKETDVIENAAEVIESLKKTDVTEITPEDKPENNAIIETKNTNNSYTHSLFCFGFPPLLTTCSSNTDSTLPKNVTTTNFSYFSYS